MERREVPIDLLVTAVLDGRPVDWDSAESSASSDDERAQIRHFRTLAAIAALHRESEAAQTESVAEKPEFWGHLRLLDPIGHGSFGEVYRAWDTKLDREVALKLLKYRDSDSDRTEARALEEGRLLARVRHPNVVTVFGADRIGDRVGIWMEFIRGRTLQQVLKTYGALSPREAAAIGLDLCRALSAVHRAGLLHRDVKAQNVMREDGGRIVLMDLGAGQFASTAESGEIAGTPLYLAPEVLRGAPATVRSDVYSVGVLLYHLVTIDFPVRGRSAQEIREGHDRGERVSLVDIRAEVPDAFVRVVECALAKNPEARYDSIGAMAAALADPTASDAVPNEHGSRGVASLPSVPGSDAAAWRWFSRRRALAAAVVLAVGLGLGTWKVASRPAAPVTPAWILVGAFENHTGEPRLDDVLQFAFEQELAQSRAISVISRERIDDTLRLMKRAPGTRIDPTVAREVAIRDGEIARVVIGRIDRVGQTYALNVRISDPRSDRSVFRAGIDVPALDALLTAVKSIAGRVRSGIGDDPRQVQADAQLEPVTTTSLEALQAYTQAMAFFNERRWASAEVLLKDAVRLDPDFASALVALSNVIASQHRPWTEAEPPIRHAFEVSDGLPSRERYFIAGNYYGFIQDHAKARGAFEALVREYPHDFWGVDGLYGETSRSDPAKRPLLARRVALRPNDFINVLNAARNYVADDGDVASATRLVERARQLDPPPFPTIPAHAAWLKVFPAFAHWAEGRVAESASALNAIGASGMDDETAAEVGLMNVTLGRLKAAEDAFRTMSSNSERQELLAYAALARQDRDGAQSALRADPHRAERPSILPTFTSVTWGKATLILWTLIQSGLVDDAQQSAGRPPFKDDEIVAPGTTEALLTAARGDTNAAVPMLEDVINRAAPGGPQTLPAIDLLTDSLMRRGDLLGAEGVLLRAGERQTTYPFTGSRGFLWLRLRARLMQIERRLGHTNRANEIARELRPLLALADRDFEPLRDLN